MSILTGTEIKKQVKDNNIYISDFNDSQLNPNSYNLRLSNEIYVYENGFLSTSKENKVKRIKFKETNKNKKEILLLPGTLYLAKTKETTWTENYVPCLSGRSSIGRLGICVHITAGFGDIGYRGQWTLELSVVQPVNITEDIEICQIYFYTIEGNNEIKYNGKYQGGKEVQSKINDEIIIKDIENIY